ncbi:hypothetical protein [Archangium sp.]|jgi:hypothetical protein|uniref:hypothetical protein n=1 Tax=Archangium sp. TaxID=1872627 RepID=UPI002ED8AFB2
MSSHRRSLPALGRLTALLAPLSLLSISCGGETPEQNQPEQNQPEQAQDVVTGQRALHRRLDAEDVRTMDEAGLSALSVLVPVGGSFETRPVIATGQGTFKFENVPPGPYYLKYRDTGYILTEHRELDLDEYFLGREGVTTVETRLPVTLSVDGLDPLTELLFLGLVTPNAGASGIFEVDSSVSPGVTSLSDAPALYQSDYGRQESIDAAKGDRSYLFQSLLHASNGVDYMSVARARALSEVTFRMDGGTSRVSGTLDVLPPRQVTIDWRRSSFELFRSAVHPLAVSLPTRSVRHNFHIMPAAGGLSKGWVGYSGELALGSIPASAQDVSFEVEYGNPYPSTWGVMANVYHNYQLPLRLPGTTSGSVTAALIEQAELGRFLSGPVLARVSPPTLLQVDGLNAWEERDLASLTPVFTWAPPTLGTPDVYEVRILRLFTRPSDPTRTSNELVANFFTQGRRLQVPPGVLQSGQTYVVRIAAKVTPGVDLTRSPHRVKTLVDYSSAEAFTSLMRAP